MLFSSAALPALARHTPRLLAAQQPGRVVHAAATPPHMVPAEVIWRGTPADSPVKDQAACGSCWVRARVTAGALATAAWCFSPAGRPAGGLAGWRAAWRARQPAECRLLCAADASLTQTRHHAGPATAHPPALLAVLLLRGRHRGGLVPRHRLPAALLRAAHDRLRLGGRQQRLLRCAAAPHACRPAAGGRRAGISRAAARRAREQISAGRSAPAAASPPAHPHLLPPGLQAATRCGAAAAGAGQGGCLGCRRAAPADAGSLAWQWPRLARQVPPPPHCCRTAATPAPQDPQLGVQAGGAGGQRRLPVP